jgi:hypothetical protein
VPWRQSLGYNSPMSLVNTNKTALFVAIALAASLARHSVLAQQPLSPAGPTAREPIEPSNDFCFRGQPLGKCKSFAIFELPFGYRLAHSNPSIQGNGEAFVGLEVGAMVNRSETNAIGAAISAASSGGDSHFSIDARSRRWLSKREYGDASLGLLGAGIHGRPMAYGLTGSVGFGYADIIGAWVGADVAPIGGPRHAAIHAGLRLGSYATITAIGIGAGLLALLGSALNGGTY